MGSGANFTQSLQVLGVDESASLITVRRAYLEKTFAAKFRGFIIGDESRESEFVTFFEAYARILKQYQMEDSPDTGDGLAPPEMFRLVFNHGVYLLITQQFLKASEKLQHAYRMNSGDVPLLIYLGYILLKRKNVYAAEKYLLRALQIDDQNADGYYLLGEVYFHSGQKGRALTMYDKARKLNPARTDIARRIKDIREPGKTRSGRRRTGRRGLVSRLFNSSGKKDS